VSAGRQETVHSGSAGSAALLEGGGVAYPRMLEAIDRARYEIRLEVYAFDLDVIGTAFVRALAAASRRGVRTSVILDGWGSAAHGREIGRLLRDSGCQVAIYHPLAAALAGRFRRDHRKILLVDDRVAFLGGINIGDRYGAVGEPSASAWVDLAVELRGEVVASLAARLRHAPHASTHRRELHPRRAGLERGAVARSAPHAAQDSSAAQVPGAPPVRVHLSGLSGGRPLRRRYLKSIGAAREELLVAHAYFLPDRRLVRSITAAARRGVRVKMLLPGRSDVPLATAATRRLYGQLLRAGVTILEHTESVLHAKAAVMDGRRLLVGSFNLDPFSLVNLETLVEVNDSELARAAKAWLEGLLQRARPVTLEEVERASPLQRWFLDALGLLVLRVAHRVARLLALR
jgi:cardiolipin synthase